MPAHPPVPDVPTLVISFFIHHPDLHAQVIATGRADQSSMASSSGPLRPEVRLRRHGVDVKRPSAASWTSECAWHLHCREHGYPRPDTDTTDYPPHPHREGERTERVTWRQITQWVRAVAARTIATADDPEPVAQLSLFDPPPAPAGDVVSSRSDADADADAAPLRSAA